MVYAGYLETPYEGTFKQMRWWVSTKKKLHYAEKCPSDCLWKSTDALLCAIHEICNNGPWVIEPLIPVQVKSGIAVRWSFPVESNEE